MVFTLMPRVYAFPADGAEVVQSGVVGAAFNLPGNPGIQPAPWRLYDDGTLIVEEGGINWTLATSPWSAHATDIERIIFTGPITAGPSLRALFYGLTNVETMDGLGYFDTRATTRMDSMFRRTYNLVELKLCCWDISGVTLMNAMFLQAGKQVRIREVSG